MHRLRLTHQVGDPATNCSHILLHVSSKCSRIATTGRHSNARWFSKKARDTPAKVTAGTHEQALGRRLACCGTASCLQKKRQTTRGRSESGHQTPWLRSSSRRGMSMKAQRLTFSGAYYCNSRVIRVVLGSIEIGVTTAADCDE